MNDNNLLEDSGDRENLMLGTFGPVDDRKQSYVSVPDRKREVRTPTLKYGGLPIGQPKITPFNLKKEEEKISAKPSRSGGFKNVRYSIVDGGQPSNTA